MLARERDTVLRQAREALVTLNTLDYRTAKQDIGQWAKVATGRFGTELADRRKDQLRKIKKSETVATATVASAPVTELRPRKGSARVMAVQPMQAHIPLVISAGGGPKTFDWIADNADGWMSTPTEQDVGTQAERLRKAWTAAGRSGDPEVQVLGTTKPSPELLAAWEQAGVTEAIWGLPDKPVDEVEAFIGRHAQRLGR